MTIACTGTSPTWSPLRKGAPEAAARSIEYGGFGDGRANLGSAGKARDVAGSASCADPFVQYAVHAVEVSAHHVGAAVPNVGGRGSESEATADLEEARLAIDAANALIQSVGRAFSSDERLALEGLLTQLQVEYVKRSGS